MGWAWDVMKGRCIDYVRNSMNELDYVELLWCYYEITCFSGVHALHLSPQCGHLYSFSLNAISKWMHSLILYVMNDSQLKTWWGSIWVNQNLFVCRILKAKPTSNHKERVTRISSAAAKNIFSSHVIVWMTNSYYSENSETHKMFCLDSKSISFNIFSIINETIWMEGKTCLMSWVWY